MIFDAYFVGLPKEQATKLGQVEEYLVHLSTYHNEQRLAKF
jgi:hypothetical protein